jgi:hypothetical protein
MLRLIAYWISSAVVLTPSFSMRSYLCDSTVLAEMSSVEALRSGRLRAVRGSSPGEGFEAPP